MKIRKNLGKVVLGGLAATCMLSSSALATEGMFANGTGARNKALAGAGVANQTDATAIAVNPAGLVHSENQLSISASLFSPDRYYNTAISGGEVRSDSRFFVIPNIAYSIRHDANTVFGLSMYGNGGMNTDYSQSPFAPGPNTVRTGIDLQQIFLSAGVGKKYGNLSVGIAPILAIQIFDEDGLGTGGTMDVAAGVALRGGIEYQASPDFKIGISGATPTYMQPFGPAYANSIFAADGGKLNLPGTIQVGVAYNMMPNLTLMADYKRIFYSDVDVIGTSTTAAVPGFGWESINVYKVGVEWAMDDLWTLRAGYSYNDSPVGPEDLPLNILAPATVKHHITAGAQYKWSESMDLEFAGMYAPEESIRNPDAFGAGAFAETGMKQWEITAGIKMKLGGDSLK